MPELRELGNLIEDELVECCRQGDALAWQEAHKRHADLILKCSSRILGNSQDAEDVVQETFLRAYRKLDQFDGRAALSTWLCKIAIRVSLRVRQKAVLRRHGELTEDIQRNSRNPALIVQDHEEEMKLEKLIDELPVRLREVFRLYSQGQPYAEIATRLRIPEGTVNSRLNKARQLLLVRAQKEGMLP